MSSFWGEPTYKPQDKEVARVVELIRKTTDQVHKNRQLFFAITYARAALAFLAQRFGPREALAVIDQFKAEVTR